MTTIKLTVSGAHAVAQLDGPLTSGMVGLKVDLSYDESWNGLTKTLVCRSSMGKPTLDLVYILANIGTESTVAPEVMVAHRHLYLGVEGRTADGTLVVPTIWADCGMIQPGAESNGAESQEVTPEVWVQLASQIGPLEDLDTDAKDNLVTAINELAQETQSSQATLDQRITQVQNLSNQNSVNLTAAKAELNMAIQNVHNQLSADISALEEEMNQLHTLEVTPEPESNDIPRVYLEGTMPMGLEETQATMTYVSKTSTFTAYLNISGVDDPSLNQEKKSFAIRMFSNSGRTATLNKSFRDWGYASNTYILRANFTDHSHARNIVASRLWNEIMASRDDYATLPTALLESPRNGASDGFPVKVYLNGTYQGIYTWNMGAERWNNPQGVLKALSNSTPETPDTPCNFRAPWSGTSGDHWAVEAGNESSLATSLNRLITFVQEADDNQFRSSIGQYLDLQSAMDYYLFQDAICGVNGLGRNLHLATYDGARWFCGCGDLDATFLLDTEGTGFLSHTCRCPKDYLESGSLLWERLVKVFFMEMKERYRQLRANVLSFSNICSHFESFMDVIGEGTYREDVEICPAIPQADANNIRQIRNAIRDRLTYCDGAMETLGQEIDYELNALADVTWTDGSYYVNGELTEKASEHCTSKFTLQNCLYQLNYSGCLYPTLYIWDKEGNYIGQVENQLSYVTGNPDYQYIFRVFRVNNFNPENVSIVPVNNVDTATETITLKPANLNFEADSSSVLATVDDLFDLETVSNANLAAKIHHANVMITIGNSTPKTTGIDPAKLFVGTFYPSNGQVVFGTKMFGTSPEDAMAFFTEHNTTIHING